ncbi:MAG TPA: glycoside hydrolase family 43 protein [Polyangiaceae bacterium]|nr:glycoside hydrolase family 43 protein [Polyangiaceae bacterium]
MADSSEKHGGEKLGAAPVVFGEPLVRHIYTADPSAHVFDGRIYIYPSHDIEAGIPATDEGDHFDMVDYHVLSLGDFGGPVVDHGPVLHLKDVPWAQKQLWAPDAAEKNGNYYLFFPAKDRSGIFRIGVATSKSPAGPFMARPEPIAGSYSIDPCAFVDDDGSAYLYFGGIWGGQLERWQTGKYDPKASAPALDAPALRPRVARLDAEMTGFDGDVRELSIVDAAGKPLLAGDTDRRFFEASWMHKHRGTYYFSYSTGDTHFLAYATSQSPLGPFTYRGRLLEPVVGWTTHHSIVEFRGRHYLFYHDSSLSGGVTHLRCVKVAELQHEADGSIRVAQPAAGKR